MTEEWVKKQMVKVQGNKLNSNNFYIYIIFSTEYRGYVFKITGGNDKQGFPMRQGIMVKGRVRILMADG